MTEQRVVPDGERCEGRVSLDRWGTREGHPDTGTENEGRCLRRKADGMRTCKQHAPANA